MPTQPKAPTPKVALEPDYQRWREVVERAQPALDEKPVMALSSDLETESEESSTTSGDVASVPESAEKARPKGDTPWTGEAAAGAVRATAVVKSLTSPASVAEGRTRSLTPDPPWGNPRLRLALWSLASVILVVAAIVLIFVSGLAAIPVAVVAIVAVSGTLRGIRVSRLERRIAQAPSPPRNLGARVRRRLRRPPPA